MSETPILAALDGWLGDGGAPLADLRKPEMKAIQPVNRESFVVLGESSQAASNDATPPVTNPVTTVSAVAMREVASEVATESAPDTWTDDETALCDARAQAFMAKGIPAQSADVLASRLMRRDRQLDDRRSCAECASFHGGHCLKRITPIGETTVYTLHRCRGFELSEGFND